MKAFPLPLNLRAYSPEELGVLKRKRALYEIAAPFVYVSAAFGEIPVPEGYCTDFASIPRIAWRYIDPEDPVIMFPSVIHDRLYTLRGDLGRGTGAILSRKACDEVLREAMLACGARRGQATVVYGAVRLGGGFHW